MKITERMIIDIYEYTRDHTMKETSKKFNVSMITIARINRRNEISRYSKVIDKWLGKK